MPSLITSDNGVSSGSAGLKTTASNDGILALQTTTSGGTATTAVTIDTAQNVGLGVTPSAWATSGTILKALDFGGGSVASSASDTAVHLNQNAYFNGTSWIYRSTAAAGNYYISGNTHNWRIAASGTAGNAITFTQAMTLDNVALGSAYSSLSLNNTTGGGVVFQQSGTAKMSIFNAANDGYIDRNNAAGKLFFRNTANGTTDATIDASGNFLVGTTSTYSNNGISVTSAFVTPTSGVWALGARNTHASNPYGLNVNFQNAAPNGTSNEFLLCTDSGAIRASIRSNGGLANYSANNVNLSDERTKIDIQDAGNYLAKICAIPVRTFKYKDQTDDFLNLGCIAQEVEAVAPELVDVSGFGETPEDGVPLKAIYQTDLQYALMKSIQELNAKVDAQAAEIAALKGN